MDINRKRLKERLGEELDRFKADHPRSFELYQEAKTCLLAGVPMNWMVRWAGGFPIYVKEAKGAYITDVDGHQYLDFCLGDTGAMTGHSPAAAVEEIKKQLERGITLMLPTEDSIWVGAELQRRFGLKY